MSDIVWMCVGAGIVLLLRLIPGRKTQNSFCEGNCENCKCAIDGDAE